MGTRGELDVEEYGGLEGGVEPLSEAGGLSWRDGAGGVEGRCVEDSPTSSEGRA